MNPVDYHFINVSLPLLSASGLYEITVSNGKFEKVTMQQERIASGDFHPCFGRTMPEGGGKWDLEGRVMLPGFVDSHMHLDKSFSLPRVPNVSGTLREALSNYNAAYAEIEKDDIKARMKKGRLALARLWKHDASNPS